jgi:hypothetical protein
MRMMGVDSVAYHRATVLARGDDHPGQALAYYASRGETPLVWGGRGAKGLGLEGAVTEEQYEALFGPGGACDPTTGERLVDTKRPGLELVISAHKSVAELGVIGRVEAHRPVSPTHGLTDRPTASAAPSKSTPGQGEGQVVAEPVSRWFPRRLQRM